MLTLAEMMSEITLNPDGQLLFLAKKKKKKKACYEQTERLCDVTFYPK